MDVVINNKFKNLIGFQNVFYNYNIILCYRYKESQTSVLYRSMLSLKENSTLNFRFFNSSCNLKNLKYFKFLTSPLCVIYTNNFNEIKTINLDGFYLYVACYNGYFINPTYFMELHHNFLFYDNNYLFIISNLSRVLTILNLFVINMVLNIISQINLIFNIFLGVHKILLLNIQNKNNN